MTVRCRWCVAIGCLFVLGCFGASPEAFAADGSGISRQSQQKFFTPEAAIEALVSAVRRGDTESIVRILGPESSRVVHSGDPVADQRGRRRFTATYEQRSRIERDGDSRATLLIGENDWPFPFPVVKSEERWSFDTQSGTQAVLDRRIGRNELSAIQVCLAYVDAQREYAATQGNVGGLHLYAAKLLSSKGKRDGLYWPTPEGQPSSPLGRLVAEAKEEGYGTGRNPANEPYHGYRYRILTSQGADAPGGAYDYVVKGKMIGGFALVAYPALWGASGLMTFVVSHDGVVYQKNLGKRTAFIASTMARFDPDSTWSTAQH